MTRHRSTRGRSRRTVLATLGALAVAPGVIAATNHVESDDDGERDDESTDGEADAESEDVSETDDDAGAARTRIVHLSPDAPTVDVYVDDELRFEEVEPYATQKGYREFEPGPYEIAFSPAGEGREAAVVERVVSVEAGDTTLAGIGEICRTTDTPLWIEQYEDDNSTPESGTGRLRLVHASPDAPVVDVTTDGETLVSGLGFGEADTVEVDAGEYRIRVRPSDCPDADPVASFDVEVDSESVQAAFAVGYVDPDLAPGDRPFGLAITQDA
jgi:hypothetical protein